MGIGERVGGQINCKDAEKDLPAHGIKNSMIRFPDSTEDQIASILENLKNGKAVGADGFTALTLRNNLEFTPVMTNLTKLIRGSGVNAAYRPRECARFSLTPILPLCSTF